MFVHVCYATHSHNVMEKMTSNRADGSAPHSCAALQECGDGGSFSWRLGWDWEDIFTDRRNDLKKIGHLTDCLGTTFKTGKHWLLAHVGATKQDLTASPVDQWIHALNPPTIMSTWWCRWRKGHGNLICHLWSKGLLNEIISSTRG